MKITGFWLKAFGLTGAWGAAFGAAPANAADQLSGFIYDNESFTQTSNAAPGTQSGAFFSIGADFNTAGDFSAASATYPGPSSPQNLPAYGTTEFNFGSPYAASLAALQTQYPFGTYSITATGVAGPQTSSISYTANAFTTTTPFISNYTSLTGLNPAAAFTALFPAFTPAGGSSEGYTFLTIYNATTDAVVFADEFQSPATTSDLIPANTFLANTSYDYELDYSDRIDGFDTPDNTFTEKGFDLRTDGTFTTGAIPTSVPEPASFALLAMSSLALAALRLRSRAQTH